MLRLLDHIRQEGSNYASLFVKRTNQAAIRLYEKLGFKIVDQYRICYYTRF
jgi:ribosomal protein S18 acetylase RimI-like enzyme